MVQKKERMIFSLHFLWCDWWGVKGWENPQSRDFLSNLRRKQKASHWRRENLEKSRVRKSATKPDPSIEFFSLQWVKQWQCSRFLKQKVPCFSQELSISLSCKKVKNGQGFWTSSKASNISTTLSKVPPPLQIILHEWMANQCWVSRAPLPCLHILMSSLIYHFDKISCTCVYLH